MIITRPSGEKQVDSPITPAAKKALEIFLTHRKGCNKRGEQLHLFPNEKEKEEMAHIKEGPNPPTPKTQNPYPGHPQRREHPGGFPGSKQLGTRDKTHPARRDTPDATSGGGGE